MGSSPVFISGEGTLLNIREGEVYEKMRNRYIAFEMDEKSVLVTLKAKVIKTMKLKNGK
jgi:predicted transport protein